MSKHTQGPWKVKFQDTIWGRAPNWEHTHSHWVIKGPDKKHSPVALIRDAGYGMGPSMAVRKANATLIAAAPDLLAALEAVIEDLEGGIAQADEEGASQDWLEDANNRLDAAKAAIAKATGANQ
jgi:hypothetical protein